jgi:hypothetical protein
MKFWILAALIVAAPLSAQQQPIALDSCLYKIPKSAFKRVPVFLEANADSAVRPILPAADLFAQSVGLKIRELLGAGESNLPEADSAVDWRRVWGQLDVVVRRDGPLTWHAPEWSVGADTSKSSAPALLARALNLVIASGETVSLPDGFPADSAVFGLAFVNPTVRKDGRVIPVRGRRPVAVFTLEVAWTKNPEMLAYPHIDYPAISRSSFAIGNVVLSFAVDKKGQIDMQSVKEIWPHGVKRLAGTEGAAYDAFLKAVKRGLPTGKYAPAIIGGCTVSQTVVQTFEFRMP